MSNHIYFFKALPRESAAAKIADHHASFKVFSH